MGAKTKIEWTRGADGGAGATWTPIRARNKATGKVGELFLDEDILLAPLRWKRPRRIFVCSMSDLFAGFVPDEWIDRVFAVMALAPQHVYLILTKRSARMKKYISNLTLDIIELAMDEIPLSDNQRRHLVKVDTTTMLSNVLLGVSVEDQPRADERIPDLLATPAAVRFVSYEPALGPIDFTRIIYPNDFGYDDVAMDALRGMTVDTSTGADLADGARGAKLDWIITGGESGQNARGVPRAWFQSIRDQCAKAGVAYFHKQNGEWIDADEWFDIISSHSTPLRCNASGEFSPWTPTRPLNYDDAARLAEITGRKRYEHQSGGSTLIRVGKRAAGRLLDGRTHDEFPESRL